MTNRNEPHPHVGEIYLFNKVRAKVIGMGAESVSWIEPERKRPETHTTPRWYFEAHSSITIDSPSRRRNPPPHRHGI